MNKTNIAFSAFVLALAFTSCVSAPKKETEKTEQVIQKEEDDEQESDRKTEETSEKIELEKTETKQEEVKKADWTNSAWRVSGENGSECIESVERLLVDGSKDVFAKIVVQNEKRLSIMLEGIESKALNTWSTSFSVSVQDSFGIEFILNEAMRDGKLFLNEDNSELISELLASGGGLIVLLTNEENSSEQYSFSVPNPDGLFTEAMRELKARHIGE